MAMIISRAPVRLSMGGGGTDLPSYYTRYGGFLLATSINKFVYIMVNRRFYESIRLSYSQTEIVDAVEQVNHPIFREALRYTGIDSQIEIVSVSDVPAQCGLGASSSFLVSLLNGLYAYRKEYLTLKELAECACTIEIDILGEPIGKQDQYAAAFGGFNAYTFDKDGTVTVEPVRISEEDLDELQSNIFLFHMKKERKAGEILSDQNDKTNNGDQATIENLHMIKEMGLRTREVLEAGKIDELGEILHEHWVTKKKLSGRISDAFIDEAYEVARKNGALGGKIVGAGGGGFLMLYCPQNRARLISSMNGLGLSPMKFSFEREGARIVFYG
jgi:D-glycero-alpha-D-manno-heptose-7-phosphate kinase